MTTDLAPVRVAPLAAAAAAADQAAARHLFTAYRQRRAPHTLRRQDADLALFATFLAAVGTPAGALASEADAWRGITWGLVAAWVQWQLHAGYAVGSINVRLATVKSYARLALQAGALDAAAYAQIRAVAGYQYSEGRRVDAARETTRRGRKKAEPVSLTSDQAAALKAAGDVRDQVLMALLLDHGLRVGEVADLDTGDVDLRRGLLRFWRAKVGKTQTHRLSRAAAAALATYLADRPAGPLFVNGKGARAGTRDLARRVTALGEAAGVAGLSPHDCRHFWATAAIAGGTDLKALQDAGGWASPAMPLRYAESAEVANEGVRLAE